MLGPFVSGAVIALRVEQISDLVRVGSAFRDQITGALADPTTVTFRTIAPDGTRTALVYGVDAAVVRDALGEYRCDVELDADGRWRFRWEGTGALVTADEAELVVAVSPF